MYQENAGIRINYGLFTSTNPPLRNLEDSEINRDNLIKTLELVGEETTTFNIMMEKSRVYMYISIKGGGVYLHGYPNCCGNVIVSSLYGNSRILELAEKLCYLMGYTQLQYTVANYQGDTIKALKERGWESIESTSFINARSSRKLHLYLKNIRAKPKPPPLVQAFSEEEAKPAKTKKGR